MRWPTWSQALVAAVISGLVALALRRSRPTRWGEIVGPAALEFAFVAALYSVWRMAKNLPLTQADGAIDRAYDIVRVQPVDMFPHTTHIETVVTLRARPREGRRGPARPECARAAPACSTPAARRS